MVTTLAAEDLGLEQEVEVVDVLDLPQLYNRPSYSALLDTLVDLKSGPSSLGSTPRSGTPRSTSGTSTPFKRLRKVKSEGVPAYLTNIISSRLGWIEDEGEKEELWEVASQVLSERCGRTAMGDITRTFQVQLSPRHEEDTIELIIHEPALTGDSLGHKTWVSSSLLVQRLSSLLDHIPALDGPALELGAGTGLVGMAAACVFGKQVTMTDLPEIVRNLQRNADANADIISKSMGDTSVAILDWQDPKAIVGHSSSHSPQTFSLILAADVVYSMEHPRLLASVIDYHLMKDLRARVIVELPHRDGYAAELREVRTAFTAIGLEVVEEGTEVGYDDWSRAVDDEPAEVCCWWSVWAWRSR